MSKKLLKLREQRITQGATPNNLTKIMHADKALVIFNKFIQITNKCQISFECIISEDSIENKQFNNQNILIFYIIQCL